MKRLLHLLIAHLNHDAARYAFLDLGVALSEAGVAIEELLILLLLFVYGGHLLL